MAGKSSTKFRPALVLWVEINHDLGSWHCMYCKQSGHMATGVNEHTMTKLGNDIRWEHRYCDDHTRAKKPHPDAIAVRVTRGLGAALQRKNHEHS